MSSSSDLHRNGHSYLTHRIKRNIPPDQKKSKRENPNEMVPNIRVVPGEYEPVNVCTEEDENVISHQVDIAHNGTIHREKEEKEVTENGVLLDENRRKDVEYEPEENVVGETSFTIAFQVFIPFLIAGLGTVAAGLLLDKVQVNKLTAEGSLALYNLSDV